MSYLDVKNEHTKYDTKLIVDSKYINWEEFKNSTILVTGATGFIGTQIILSLMRASKDFNLNIKLVLPVRNIVKLKKMFWSEFLFNKVKIIKYDLNKKIRYSGKIDYVIHAASNTSSKSFVEMPAETISSIINGVKNILEFAKQKKVKSIVFLSSMEVYGIIQSDIPLKETDLGYIDIYSARNSYSLAKRLAENLCFAYFKEYNVPVKIARLSQIIGANIPYDDTRVFAQFARSVVEGNDIILHSDGSTKRNYCYITDCVSAIYAILLRGVSGECYNVANSDAKFSIREMAEKIRGFSDNIKIRQELKNPDIYLSNIKLFLDTKKLNNLNWQAEIQADQMLSKLVNGFMCQKNKKSCKETLKTRLKKYICFENFGGYKNVYMLGLRFKISNSFLYRHLYKYLPVKCNKIVVNNFGGRLFGCNPKYIVQKLLQINKKFDIVWIVDNARHKDFPKGIRTVDVTSERVLYEMSTAGVWISNVRLINFIKRGLSKKNNQKYIQTWHGSLGIKKIDRDANPSFWENLNSDWKKYWKKDSDMIDYMISNSSFETEVYRSGVSETAEIKLFGHPRNDIFFRDNSAIREKICAEYNIPQNSKILLYVPTYRDNKNISCYNINYEGLISALINKFGGEWVVLIRLHPRLSLYNNILIPENNKVIDATLYSDIQELLVSSDIAISDYSSCLFDFLLTGNPGFIYAPDIEAYNNERGFYYPLEQTPFPIARNNAELIYNIQKFNFDDYKSKVEQFLKDKGCIDDGQASVRVCDLIDQILNK